MKSMIDSLSQTTEQYPEPKCVRKPTSWRKVADTLFSFPVMSFFLLTAAIFRLCPRGIAESDIWWHMRNARFLLQYHALPRLDTYSLGAAGSGWMDHEWLSEVPFYLTFQAKGLQGLLALYFILYVLIFAGVYYRACRASGNCKDATVVTILGIALGVVSMGPRLLLLGWLCMVGLLLLLDRFRESGKGLWMVPLLFALWINLHGSWIYGMIVLIVTIASGLVAGKWGRVVARRWSSLELKKLLITLAASIAALFVNPFGYRLLLYPFDLLFRQTSNMKYIDEWQSVDFNAINGRVAMIVILGLLAAAWSSSRRWRMDEVVLAAFALWGALSHVRLFFFAGLILPPLLSSRLKLFTPYERQVDKPWLNAAVMAAVVGALVFFYPSEAMLRQKVNGEYPTAAMEFMQQQHVNGKIFNSYKFGGYMEWYSPELKPFIDGRADIFVYNGAFDDYGKVSMLRNSFELLDKYNIDYVLYERNEPLSYLLDHSAQWQVIYADNIAKLYHRAPSRGSDQAIQASR